MEEETDANLRSPSDTELRRPIIKFLYVI